MQLRAAREKCALQLFIQVYPPTTKHHVTKNPASESAPRLLSSLATRTEELPHLSSPLADLIRRAHGGGGGECGGRAREAGSRRR
jgi:hypothetical protein